MRPRDGWPGRAALAVAVLYGFLLSTLLGAMAPIGMPSPGVLCLQDGRAPQGPVAPARAGDCCTLGCATGLSGPPPPTDGAADNAAWHAIVHETGRAWTSPASAPPDARLPRGPPAV